MSSTPAQVSPIHFRQAMSRFATGVAIATAFGADGQPHGLTVNSFVSVSLDPPLVSFCIDRGALALAHFLEAPGFAIHVLSEEQEELSSRFARRGKDRFQGLAWSRGQTGAPLLAQALALFECERRQAIAAGDHYILLGEVKHATAGSGAPLLYFESRYRRLGA